MAETAKQKKAREQDAANARKSYIAGLELELSQQKVRAQSGDETVAKKGQARVDAIEAELKKAKGSAKGRTTPPDPSVTA